MDNAGRQEPAQGRWLGQDMRLGRIEFLAMNNPIRRWIQKHVEFRIFRRFLDRHGIDLTGGVFMDAGCGSGYSTELIVQQYSPSRVIAFDFMPEQIRLAERRGLDVPFAVGDLRAIECESSMCDAVFIFGVIHHIAEWQAALAEVARVLKPGGVLLLEEPRYRFTWPQLEAGIQAAGMSIVETKRLAFHWFHSYLCRKGGRAA